MTHINQRRDTAVNWAAANPILQLGELGWERNTGKAKLGDGVTPWNSLPYVINTPPDMTAYATLANPTFTGDPKAPTPATADNDTSIATTAFVKAQGYVAASALAPYAPLASPALTGNPTAPTPLAGDNDTSIATTAFVKAQAYLTAADIAGKADLASPVFTGNPTAPTPAPGDNDTSLATTAFVTTAVAGKADLASPALTGNPTAPTPVTSDNDTSIATTAFVKAQGYQAASALGSAAFVNTGIASGQVALLNASGRFDPARLGSGAPDGTKYLRDDGTFAVPAGGGGGGGSGDVVGPGASVSGNLPTFSGTSGKIIQDSGTAVASVALLDSPAFVGTPLAPTPLTADNTTRLATTAFVKAQGYAVASSLATIATTGSAMNLTATGTKNNTTYLRGDDTWAPIPGGAAASETVAGIAEVATQAEVTTGTDDTRMVSPLKLQTRIAGLAPLADPVFTGNPTAPTPLTADNDTSIATTAFVKAQGYAVLSGLATVATTGSALSLTATGTKDSTTFLRGDNTWASITPAAASEGAPGIIEIATQAETNAGTDDARAVTPWKFQTRLAAYAQPLDGDLTSIAALTTAAYGRSLLTLADQAALRTAIGLATVATSGSAADLSTGTLPDARLPGRLGLTAAASNTITDWNNATASGWYYGANTAANGPTAGYYVGRVLAAGTNDLMQIVTEYGASQAANTMTWARNRTAGAWTAWYKLMWSQQESDARYLNASNLNAGTVPDARLPGRLGPDGATTATIADANTATANGWYYAPNTAANIPTAAHYIIEVAAASSINLIQTATEYQSSGAANTKTWRRNKASGVWGAWYPLLLSQGESDARYMTTTALVSNAQLPDRLKVGGYAIPAGNDWNNAIDTGWYSSSDATNAPGGGAGWLAVKVQMMAQNPDYVWQLATRGTVGGGSTMFQRFKAAGTWTAWQSFDPTEALDYRYRARNEVAAGTVGGLATGAVSFDLSTNVRHFVTSPSGNITISFTNTPAGFLMSDEVVIAVAQGATVRTVSLGTGLNWLGSAPTQVANKTCVIRAYTFNAGSTWFLDGKTQV